MYCHRDMATVTSRYLLNTSKLYPGIVVGLEDAGHSVYTALYTVHGDNGRLDYNSQFWLPGPVKTVGITRIMNDFHKIFCPDFHLRQFCLWCHLQH